jgi:hypothetical protein
MKDIKLKMENMKNFLEIQEKENTTLYNLDKAEEIIKENGIEIQTQINVSALKKNNEIFFFEKTDEIAKSENLSSKNEKFKIYLNGVENKNVVFEFEKTQSSNSEVELKNVFKYDKENFNLSNHLLLMEDKFDIKLPDEFIKEALVEENKKVKDNYVTDLTKGILETLENIKSNEKDIINSGELLEIMNDKESQLIERLPLSVKAKELETINYLVENTFFKELPKTDSTKTDMKGYDLSELEPSVMKSKVKYEYEDYKTVKEIKERQNNSKEKENSYEPEI